MPAPDRIRGGRWGFAPTAHGVGGFCRGPLATLGVGDGVGLRVGVGVGVALGVGVGVGDGLAVGVGVEALTGGTSAPGGGRSGG